MFRYVYRYGYVEIEWENFHKIASATKSDGKKFYLNHLFKAQSYANKLYPYRQRLYSFI